MLLCTRSLAHSACSLIQSYDATTHFESTVEDILDVYKRVTGKDLGMFLYLSLSLSLSLSRSMHHLLSMHHPFIHRSLSHTQIIDLSQVTKAVEAAGSEEH